MAKNDPKRGLDEQLLEGGGGGGGMRSVSGTKYSNMPSFTGNASVMDDIKKLTRDTSHLKGGAKTATDLAEARAAKRMVGRAAGAAAAGAGVNAAVGDSDSEDTTDNTAPASAGMGEIMSGKGMKKGGMTASRRADGIAQRGKTKGKVC